ncbi:DUF3885 domain-containing protein [Luteipulveratus flavus]
MSGHPSVLRYVCHGLIFFSQSIAPIERSWHPDGVNLRSAAELAAFDGAWRARWPAVRPVGHELRSSASATWVRFHSLPGSKRYAETKTEYDEVLTRHRTALGELSALAETSPEDIRAITVSWSDSPEPAEPASEPRTAFGDGTYWRSVPYDLSDPGDPYWAHLYVTPTALGSPGLEQLLLLVADDGTRDVILCAPGAEWLYHPYDGGGDVIAPDRAARNVLRTRHPDWLSKHPQGL